MAYIIVKLQGIKDKEKLLKAGIKDKLLRETVGPAAASSLTEVRRQWSNVLKAVREKIVI